jgi:hypothetical protein
MVKVAQTLQTYADGVLRSVWSGFSTWFMEGLNSLIKATKA